MYCSMTVMMKAMISKKKIVDTEESRTVIQEFKNDLLKRIKEIERKERKDRLIEKI